jgi:hypothetical protein
LVKMNLSRAAKQFRAQMPEEPQAPKRAKASKKSKAPPPPPPVADPAVADPAVSQPVDEAVTPIDPIPEPEVPAEAATPAPVPTAPSKKAWRVKPKRPRFVRETTERRERVAAPVQSPRSTKPAARLLTKNLSLPPKDDSKAGR